MKNKLILVFCFAVLAASCKRDVDRPRLVPDFEADALSIKVGESVNFKDISNGNPSKWKWTFAGGTPGVSNLSSPVVKYENAGKYAVTLQLLNSYDSVILKKDTYITVGNNPVAADFSADKLTALQDEAIVFTDLSTGRPTTWSWEFIPKTGVAIVSVLQNPSIQFTEPGVYTVKLKSSNSEFSNEKIRTDYITVIDKTAINALFTSDQTATYTGGSIKFTDASIGVANSWTWTFEGGTPASSTDRNPQVVYSTPGRYKVKLTAANAFKSSDMEKTAYILVVPGESLTAFYPLNDSIGDVGPSKLVSTLIGTVAFTSADRNLAVGKTGEFNASGGFIVPDNDAMNFASGDYSVSCWIKTAAASRGMVWQESGAKGSGDNQTWLRLLGTATNLTSFSTEDDKGGSTINLTTASNGAVATTNNGVWHHIVCVRQGTLSTMYIDGVKIKDATSATGIKVTSNNSPFKIGMQEGVAGYSNQFVGLIDDIIIYKKALTLADVILLRNL